MSRQKTDNSTPHEIIPVSFNIRDILQERYYNLHNTEAGDKYLAQTRSQPKSSEGRLPEVHGIEKGLDPYVIPERQKPISSSTDMRPPVCKPRLDKVDQMLGGEQG